MDAAGEEDGSHAEVARAEAAPPTESTLLPSWHGPPDRDHDLHGIVIGPNGERIPGADVMVRRAWARDINPLDLEYHARTSVVERTSSSAEGEFRVRVERGLLYDLEARRGELVSALIRDRSAGEYVEVPIAPASVLHGTVTEAVTGEPLGGTPVRVFHLGGAGAQHETLTDSSGAYRIEGLYAARWSIEVVPARHEAPPWGKVEIVAGAEVEHSFVLSPGRTIRGRVLEEGSGAPIPGAELTDSWVFRRVARTDAQGTFEARGLNLDHDWSELYVRAPGFQKREFLARSLDLDATLEFRLLPAAVLRGTLLRSDGRPAAGAYVAAVGSVYPDDLQSVEWAAATASSGGGFELRDVRTDLPLALFARLDGVGTLYARLPGIVPGQVPAELGTFRLPAACSVAGTVLQAGDFGAADLEQELRGPDLTGEDTLLNPKGELGHYLFVRRCRTDDLGRFRYVGLRAGPYELKIKSPGTPEVVLPLALSAGQDLDLEPILLGAGGVIAGRVVNESGAPVPDAYVTLRSVGGGREISMRTDADGTFSFERLREGEHLLGVRAPSTPDARSAMVPVQDLPVLAGTRDLVVRLPRGGWISGTIVESATLKAEVCEVRALDAHGEEVAVSFADFSGEFRILVPAGASLRLEFWPKKLLPGREQLGIRIPAVEEPAAVLESVPEGASGLRVTLP